MEKKFKFSNKALAVNEKDLKAIEIALRNDIKYIAASFIRNKEDIEEVRNIRDMIKEKVLTIIVQAKQELFAQGFAFDTKIKIDVSLQDFVIKKFH